MFGEAGQYTVRKNPEAIFEPFFMPTPLPLIVGFGGYNAAGRSSGHQAYQRMIFESLSAGDKAATLDSLAHLMGSPDLDPQSVLDGTLIRRIESSFFDVDNTAIGKNITLKAESTSPVSFDIAGRDLPHPIPEHWRADPLDEGGRRYKITIDSDQTLLLKCRSKMAVQSAGQLPTGFDPGSHYRSQHHPRGLQLAILAASDAVQSMGIDWQRIVSAVAPDEIGVYSSSVMSQLDNTGLGGMMQSRALASRVTSKQLALGLNTMPADFINAYVLGSVGITGGMTGACATFLYNLNQGVAEIKSGRRKVVVVGSAEAPIIPEIIDGYAAMSALATDADLCKLDGLAVGASPDFRRASRPFGENCGFTLAESAQYVVLMADDLAVQLGAQVFGAVPGVYINADGFKKSISAPGAGNYLTMAKAVGLARSLLGDEAIQQRSFVQAHGSSTPHNRTTESKIFDQVARAFGIEHWPVAAVKSYLGHSLGPASGDQMAATLGAFAQGVVPGIKTIDGVADDVFGARLHISNQDIDLGCGNIDVAFLNSKGFGGNNATATVLSPTVVNRYLERHYSGGQWTAFQDKQVQSRDDAARYLAAADKGDLRPIYEFGTRVIDEEEISISNTEITLPGFANPVSLGDNEGYDF
ncbi:beta-ketoacyl synthase [Teredinibacter turnerae T7901]|uniref:Beta-ketoacyl synthase n=1 Tax=Teredinibacter turnerae (strain ATCC 39867 / T7901) TaxID=377629 RepID=C5BTI5_TERTT|nr:beta-ketoacyl synthase [Teredinibacter turnerae T7901]